MFPNNHSIPFRKVFSLIKTCWKIISPAIVEYSYIVYKTNIWWTILLYLSAITYEYFIENLKNSFFMRFPDTKNRWIVYLPENVWFRLILLQYLIFSKVVVIVALLLVILTPLMPTVFLYYRLKILLYLFFLSENILERWIYHIFILPVSQYKLLSPFFFIHCYFFSQITKILHLVI